ncbi:MAG: glutamine--fructose-6-phosphate transaminase (isomerizing), partial [Pseudomonadota bacterium]
QRRRAEGKIRNLEARLAEQPLDGAVGIGHTRWATHGAPNEANAHPHATERVAIVHNGIIENYRGLRAELEGSGRNAPFASDTDTEVAAHLIDQLLSEGAAPAAAMAAAMARLDGAFAIAAVFAGRHDLMIGARRGSPLAVGWGDGEMYLGSDAMALAPLTKRIAYLEEGDFAVLTPNGAEIFDETGAPADRPIRETALSGALIGKGDHRHFMHKEIHEQPAVIGDTLHSLLNAHEGRIALPDLPIDLASVGQVATIACGTAYYAGMVGKLMIEKLARVPVESDVASEFRYREAPIAPFTLALLVSQSGETADTLAALRYVKGAGGKTLGVVNAPESSIAREADGVLPTLAGPEIGVASTKAFTTQLAIVTAFAVAFARARGAIDAAAEARFAGALAEAPSRFAEALHHEDAAARIAHRLAEARDVLYLGRGAMHPLAMEGALKLKEISYVHAEGYAAGEMK